MRAWHAAAHSTAEEYNFHKSRNSSLPSSPSNLPPSSLYDLVQVVGHTLKVGSGCKLKPLLAQLKRINRKVTYLPKSCQVYLSCPWTMDTNFFRETVGWQVVEGIGQCSDLLILLPTLNLPVFDLVQVGTLRENVLLVK